jgi:hypothetical protein
MTINTKKRTIEISSKENKDAVQVGSEKYQLLQTARKDYPGFTVVIKKATRKKDEFAWLTKDAISNYVSKYGTDEQKENYSILCLTGLDEKGHYYEAQPFFKIKKWFLKEFPGIKSNQETISNIYKAAAEKAAKTAKTNPEATNSNAIA